MPTTETIRINGRDYTLDELEEIVGVDALQDPIDTEELQRQISEANRQPSILTPLLLAAVFLAGSAIVQGDRLSYRLETAQYIRASGDPVPPWQIEQWINEERRQASARMERRSRLLLNGRISLEVWQRNQAQDIYYSHLRMVQAGAGTAAEIRPRHLQRLYERLHGMPHEGGLGVGEMQALGRFARQIRAGELSEAMILARSRRYGENVGASYYEADHVSRVADGTWEGFRRLDPAADHCPECPAYATAGWVPADQIVAKGERCSCRAACRCNVAWRRVGDGVSLLGDRLI